MRKFLYGFICFALTFSSAKAQFGDSVIVAQGKIFNAETNEPVQARISYQSVPYGSRIGSLNSSSYSFPMFDNEKYSVVVEAAGYLPAKYMLDPAEANESRRVVKDIALKSGSTSNHTPGHVMRINNLIFQAGTYKISQESHDALNLVVRMMNENQKMIIQLEGHTDIQGNAEKNMKLSRERVEAVKSYLAGKGIPKQRIRTKAFGSTMPLSRDNTPEAHTLNRRVELRILSN